MTVRQFDSHPAGTGRQRFEDLRRADPELRRNHVVVRSTALQRGVAVDPAALTAVLGALLDEERHGGPPANRWTEARVIEFMWTTCLLWCARRGVRPPADVADAVRAYWGHLAVTDGFSADSDDRETLRLALRSCAPPRPRGRIVAKRPSTTPRAPA